MREHMGCGPKDAVGQVIIPCLRKQDKRFGVSRINRIERALFNNRKLAIEVMRQNFFRKDSAVFLWSQEKQHD